MKKILSLFLALLLPLSAQAELLQYSPSSGGGGGGSGTVTSVATGTGLTGGPITTTGTISLATGTNNTLAGYSGVGAFSGVTVGTGLSLSGGTLTASGSAPAFSAITSGTNTIAAMLVGTGGTLGVTGTGTIIATGSVNFTSTGNGAASASPFNFTGIPFAGTGTTSTPLVYLNTTSASAPTSWSGAGTMFGMNAISTFAGNFMDLHDNGGASLFSIGVSGNVSAASNITNLGMTNYMESGGSVAAMGRISTNTDGLGLSNMSVLTWSNSGAAQGSTQQTYISSPGAATVHLGAADAASPIAQTLGAQGVLTGTSNTSAPNLVIAGPIGTGTGAGGGIFIQNAPAGSTGSTQNALVTALEATPAANILIPGVLSSPSVSPHQSARLAQTTPLTATYSNGTSGVGATLTNAGAQAALTIDSVAASVGDRVVNEAQASTFQNGIYVVTNIGSGSTNWVETRASDYDGSLTGVIAKGSSIAISEGTNYTGAIFVETGAGPFTIGTTAITFAQNSAGSIVGGYAASVSNSDGTITCTPTTGNVVCSLALGHSNIWTAAQTNSTSGAASVSAENLTGTPFIGTTTTSTPLMYFNDAVTQPTTWNSTASVGGTYLGFNALTGFTGNFIDAHVNGGVSLFSVTGTGSVTAGGSISGTNLLGTALIRSTSAAGASTAVFTANGALFTGGSGTTNFPQWFAQPSAASAVTTWSTFGTVFGANEASGFGGNFLDFHVNGGASLFSVGSTGAVASAGAATFTGRINSTLSAGTNTSAFLANGVLATGGSGTTNFPQYFAQSAGSAVTTWSTSGTYFGVNALSSFTGNFEDYHVNGGTSVWAISSTGATTQSGLETLNGGIYVAAGYVESANFTANSGTSLALNIDNGPTQVITVTGAVAMTLATPTHTGKTMVKLLQDGTGHVYSITGCKWPGGTAITYSTAANAYDIVSIWYDGTNFNCMGGAAFQ